jgi:hypothetical protein
MGFEIEDYVEQPARRSDTWEVYGNDLPGTVSASTSAASSSGGPPSIADDYIDMESLKETDPEFYDAQVAMLEAHTKRQERAHNVKKMQEWCASTRLAREIQ